jgi:hypothetical protein
VVCTVGAIQLMGMGTVQPSGQLGLVLLWGGLVWPPCQRSSFPKQLLHLPFGAWQCITATHLWAHIVSSSLRISHPYLIYFPPELISPLGHECCKGIFRVSVDVYLYSCSELECPYKGDKFSLLSRCSNRQQIGLNDLSPESPLHTQQSVCHPGQSCCPLWNTHHLDCL